MHQRPWKESSLCGGGGGRGGCTAATRHGPHVFGPRHSSPCGSSLDQGFVPTRLLGMRQGERKRGKMRCWRKRKEGGEHRLAACLLCPICRGDSTRRRGVEEEEEAPSLARYPVLHLLLVVLSSSVALLLQKRACYWVGEGASCRFRAMSPPWSRARFLERGGRAWRI